MLVVEDQLIVAVHLEHRLKQLGYSIAGVVHDGEQAVVQVLLNKPDIILMDINLGGGMGGIEAALAIQEKQEAVRKQVEMQLGIIALGQGHYAEAEELFRKLFGKSQ